MEKVTPNSKFVGHLTEIIWQSKVRATTFNHTGQFYSHLQPFAIKQLKALHKWGYFE